MLKKLGVLMCLWMSAPTLATPSTSLPAYGAGEACDAVQLTQVTTNSGDVVPVPGLPLDPAFCYQIVDGNDTDNNFKDPGNTNLGYKDDGYLNTDLKKFGLWDENGAFTTSGELQDLKTPGVFEDPGWVKMGKWQNGSFVGDSSSNLVPSLTNPNVNELVTYTYVSSLFSLTNCYTSGNVLDQTCSGGDLVRGQWQLKPPANNPDALKRLLGTDRFFDSIALIFKSGNDHAIYNFKASQLGLAPGIGTAYENLVFTGSWDMSDVIFNGDNGGSGLSHVSVWGRDPTALNVEISAPVNMLGLFIGGLVLIRRRLQMR